MLLSPQRRSPSLANADQTVTKVDKTDHRQPSTIPAPHSGAARTDLNIPEQIRTNLNSAERSDQIGRAPGSPLNTPKKIALNSVVARSGRLTPHLTSPLEGGRDECS